MNQALRTLAACRPLGPRVTSNSTLSPSASDLKPEPWIALKCTNTSSPPSCVMNPNPLASLNHFTLPMAMLRYLPLGVLAPCALAPGRGLPRVPRQNKTPRELDLTRRHKYDPSNQKREQDTTDCRIRTCDSLRARRDINLPPSAAFRGGFR